MAWVVVNTSMQWEDLLNLTPERLKYISEALERRRVYDKLAIFEANLALYNEESLSRLKSELRECERD